MSNPFLKSLDAAVDRAMAQAINALRLQEQFKQQLESSNPVLEDLRWLVFRRAGLLGPLLNAKLLASTFTADFWQEEMNARLASRSPMKGLALEDVLFHLFDASCEIFVSSRAVSYRTGNPQHWMTVFELPERIREAHELCLFANAAEADFASRRLAEAPLAGWNEAVDVGPLVKAEFAFGQLNDEPNRTCFVSATRGWGSLDGMMFSNILFVADDSTGASALQHLFPEGSTSTFEEENRHNIAVWAAGPFRKALKILVLLAQHRGGSLSKTDVLLAASAI